MAELALKIGRGADYEEGDIVDAFNRLRIRRVHAEMICHVRHAGFTPQGLRPDGLARAMHEICLQYRFERVSRNEIERVEIASGERKQFSSLHWVSEGWLRRQGIERDQLPRRYNDRLRRYERLYAAHPNAEGEYIEVEEYLAHQLRHKQHAIFGRRGAEVWYGGREDVSDAKLDLVWQEIETRTPLREIDFRQWPAGGQDLRSFLFVAVDEFDDETLREWVTPLYAPLLQTMAEDDDSAVGVVGKQRRIVQKRRYRVPFRTDLGLSARRLAEIDDPATSVDLRDERVYVWSDFVELKLAPVDAEPVAEDFSGEEASAQEEALLV
ncbi:MAG: hypothetical protein K8T91_03250 [Planctomycetes bacterium]|nr:hypothetical protein [Planctomycetota bacterium]